MITINYDPKRSFRVWCRKQIWLGEDNDNGGRVVPNINDIVIDTDRMFIYRVVAVDINNTPSKLPTYVPTLQLFVLSDQQINILNHEKLSNLLGGNTDGHYHLTEEQLSKLNEIFHTIDNLTHENLPGLLGGNTNEHYHLTLDEYERFQQALTFVETNGDLVFGRGLWNENVIYESRNGSKVPDFVISRDFKIVYASPRD